jgi:hypothetical protein
MDEEVADILHTYRGCINIAILNQEKVVLILFAGSHDDAAAFLRGKS